MKTNKTIRFGKAAQNILLYSLPFMIFFSFMLTLYIARLDGIEFLNQRETILFSLETLSRISLCLAIGTVLADDAEKKTAANR